MGKKIHTDRAICPFTVGRKNRINVDSIRGAESSTIIYSRVETAKANSSEFMTT